MFCQVGYFFQSVREKPYPDEDRVKGDPARDLATVHHVCETHLSELGDISRELNSVKVLIYFYSEMEKTLAINCTGTQIFVYPIAAIKL